MVCEQLPDTMVAANSYNVDGIAGATVTSDALKEAVKAALTSAGLDASAFAVAQTSDAAVEKLPRVCIVMWSLLVQAVPV